MTDQETTGREKAEQETTERQTAEKKAAELHTAEQLTAEKKAAELHTAEQLTAEHHTAEKEKAVQQTDEQITTEKSSAKEKSAEKTNRPKRNSPANPKLRRSFVACPRCSFFFVGYDLIHDDLESSMENTAGKWLDLTWSMSTRKLVQKSYGVVINQDDTRFEGMCGDCRRVFIYDSSESEPPQVTFSVKINPTR